MNLRGTTVVDYGSPYATAKELDTDTWAMTGALVCLPIKQASELTDTTETETVQDEGLNEWTKDSTRAGTYKITSLMLTPDLMEWVTTTSRGKEYVVCDELHRAAIGGFHYYHIIPRAKIKNNLSLSKPTANMDIEFDIQTTTALMSLDLTELTESSFQKALTCTELPVPVGTYWIKYAEAE